MKELEIAKALRTCASPTDCAMCPVYDSKNDECNQRKLWKDAADAIERLVAERDQARRIARLLPEVCDEDCAGDPSVGIHECPAYQFPDVGHHWRLLGLSAGRR